MSEVSGRQKSILEAATRVIARRGVRGLRVEELSAEAGVSTALLYYHFKDRANLLRRTLEFISDRADRYTGEGVSADDPRAALERTLLQELQDEPDVRENSTAWGELRASAIFEPELQDQLRASTEQWVRDIAELVERTRAGSATPVTSHPTDTAERLTALVEGLSERWLSGSITLERARHLLRDAIAAELGETLHTA
ncbi:TetR/AcrR family transcriptional regulator [Microtetraspora fusca]|uniref:TetR/AcrR family transcriptional regulator n=1 Tax=Microtetraspora fusca TaxID=1997 RepID=A0ABW6UZF1_MICFU|nr:TetR/AcrR family transcriptional regulator [Microtetraspora fusca]